MNKQEQLKKALSNEGINIDNFKQGNIINSILLDNIVGGGGDPQLCSHGKSKAHERHDKVHSDSIIHSKCKHN